MILMTALTLKSQTQKYKLRTLYLLMKMLRQWGGKKQGLEERISSKMGYIFIGTLFLFGFLIQFILFKPLISVKAI